jgi:hypothetical protein
VARLRGKYLLADLRDTFERPGRLSGLVLVVVGGLILLVGLLAVVLVGPDSSWSASRTVEPHAPAVVLTSGVVGALGPQVTVTARRTDGGQLFIGRAISGDVRGLTGSAPRLVLTGVRPLHRLVAHTESGSTGLADVQGADIWRESNLGSGARSLDWRPDDDQQSILIASSDGSALPQLKVTVSWHRSGWFPGSLLLIVVGASLFGWGMHRWTDGHGVDGVLNTVSRIPLPARRSARPKPEPDPTPEGGAT